MATPSALQLTVFPTHNLIHGKKLQLDTDGSSVAAEVMPDGRRVLKITTRYGWITLAMGSSTLASVAAAVRRLEDATE